MSQIRTARARGGERAPAHRSNLTPDTRAGLIDGVIDMVIATPTALLAASTVEAMANAIENPAPGATAQVLLPFNLFIPENL